MSLKGINVHDPKYGRWVEREKHLKTAGKYNEMFSHFLREHPDAKIEDIENFAESLMKRYGL